jgi:hypothetical protein
VKKSTNKNIKELRDEIIERDVSKESLSSIFMDYSLRLKDSSIERELINEISKDKR